ncbi:glycosyltransferase involved in cell wall biosynthesis [Lipingzhangella halophila]|uniref:4,4'-diaponeurosporenoate glycosyltransferase n=1 Tax=Lipingzhangella halophila TaxID=1783352 RepID=A0A7W7RJJ7_9ACTN|nr:glycosyltransferase [Lipingzhangella halophila]MBB4932768.1 glycosyltransferase involved in cell wall biosynthesis [Lipingzhangella halophila]
MIRAAAVAVPAHDEASVIVPCLRAVTASLASCRLAPERQHLVVVADACNDATAAIARGMGAHVVEIAHRSVGVARSEGMRYALGITGVRSAEEIWLATTDADSLVPLQWLPEQLRYADAGWDAVAGTVVVQDWSQRPPGLAEAFAQRYRAGRFEHPHIHGANLGIRASAYLASGGFRGLACSEDSTLVAALRARGHSIRRPSDLSVLTSARPDARVCGGFGDTLTCMVNEIGL